MFGRVNQNTGSGRPVCKFFLEGRCRFGDSCKNEHPAGGAGNSSTAETYSITTDSIKTELSTERPTWPLSCYAPGKNAPRQLIDAEFEHSPEEMRVMHYLALAQGQLQESRETMLANGVQSKVQAILADLNGAMKYVIDGKDQHPNRLDQVAQTSVAQNNPTTTSAFGTSTTPASTFGQPSSFGRNTSTNAFGQAASAQPSAFGQPSKLGGGSSFGTPSGLGQNAAFGQPSAMGQSSAFGQPSALGGSTSAFGKPGFGQASQPSSAFGAPSQLGQKPAFGQPTQSGGSSPFGQASQPGQISVFGQASQPNQGSAFGQVSQPGAFGQAAPAFGQSGFSKTSPFGGAATHTQTQSAFGQASTLGTNKPSPFGAMAGSGNSSPFATTAGSSNASPFGSGSGGTATTSPFAAAAANNAAPAFAAPASTSTTAQSSAFGQPSAPSPFGTPGAAAPSSTSTFGQPSAFGAKQSPFAAASAAAAPATTGFGAMQSGDGQSPFGASTVSTTSGTASAQHLVKDASGRLSAFKGKPVTYDAAKKAYFTQNSRSGKPERIWFSDGAPAPIQDAQGSSELYEGTLAETLARIYLNVKETGTFKDGVVPEIPPKADWVSFDI